MIEHKINKTCQNIYCFFLINSLAGGGAERVALRLLDLLGVEKIFLLEKDVNYDISYERITILSTHSKDMNPILKTLYIPLYAKRLIRYISKNDIVLSMLERANYVNIVSSFRTKHKTIISVHMSQIKGRSRGHPYNLLSKLLYPRADIVACVSKAIANELIKYYGVSPSKIRIIYNPVDIENIELQMKEPLENFSIIFEKPSIITVGRLAREKGQWYLLRIFSELKRRVPDLKLVILGDGELRNYLVTLSENLGLKTFVWNRDTLRDWYDVYFLGFHKNPFKFMAKAKLFVFPSLWEGFGNVLVEAMACGIPVVSSDCRSGPREIIAPDTDFERQTKEPEFARYGILLPVFDKRFRKADEPLDRTEKLWLEILENVICNEELLRDYSQRSLERAQHFKSEIIAKEWKKVIAELT